MARPHYSTSRRTQPTNGRRRLYDAAGLEKPHGLGWHGLRRLWVTKCRGNPLPDLMAAGGWGSLEAMMPYLKTDEDTIARIIQQPTLRKLEPKLERAKLKLSA